MLKKLKQKRCSNCKYNFKTEHLNCCDRPDKNGLHILYEDDIETILTHEQYEQNCYKIERS